MFLRSTFSPIFTAIPTRTRPPKFSRASVANGVTQQYPQGVRQIASDNAARNASSLLVLPKLPPTSAYIHLPFCRKRCHYCDFPIIALGSSPSLSSSTTTTSGGGGGDDPRILNYVETLCREIKASKVISDQNPPLRTVFFGGGTPSLVPPKLVSLVLDTLNSKFGIRTDAEISMEMDPGTFDGVKLKELQELGVNRVSLGVQAFQEELLKACGRAHGVEEIHEAIETVKSCGIENWSMDLISSLPHQTADMWEESLKLSIQIQPAHVSVYDLQIEQGTKFGTLFTPGEFPLPSENQSAEFYKMASTMLGDAGYDHYEISSYSKRGYHCKHNLTYWKNKSFYGFGLGSASYVAGVRFSRPRRLKEYMGYVQNLEDELVDSTKDSVTEYKDLAMDVLMLSLRTARGLDLKSYGEAFGCSLLLSICEVYKPYVESGHMTCLDEEGRNITLDNFSSLLSDGHETNKGQTFLRLSDPDGFLLSNELISLAFGVISP